MLGAHGVLPVEVVHFAAQFAAAGWLSSGWPAEIRLAAGQPLITDNGNCIVDCRVRLRADLPATIEPAIRRIPGVIDTGLFLGMADTVLVQHGSPRSRHPPSRAPSLATHPTAMS